MAAQMPAALVYAQLLKGHHWKLKGIFKVVLLVGVPGFINQTPLPLSCPLDPSTRAHPERIPVPL